MKKKPNLCTTCGKMLKKDVITYEGKKFCCQKCRDKYKKGGVCEFC